MRRLTYRGSVYGVLLAKMLLVLVFLSITRLLFYLLNLQYFNEIDASSLFTAFAGGLRFDITSLVVLNSLYIFMLSLPLPFRRKKFWQKSANIIFYSTNIIGFSLNMIDTVYFRFTAKRMTADIFSFVKTGEDDVVTLIPRFIRDFALEVVLWVLISAIFVWIASRIKVKPLKHFNPLRFYLLNTALFLITGAVAIIGIRGGFQLRPISIITAGEYASAKNISLVLNTPFTIIKSFGKAALKEHDYFESNEVASGIFNPIQQNIPQDTSESFKPYNIVLIIMESFGTEYIGALNEHTDVSHTPNLDTIISRSLTFKAYANGKQSMEALPAIVAGLPSLSSRPYIISSYSGNRINSLANLLAPKAYTTSFFHGGRNGTMGFESFTSVAGFDTYYGKQEFGDDDHFDGTWGIYDGPFFEFFRHKLDVMPQPFLSAIFSLSSHHPYKVPDAFKGRFNKGTLEIHESIMYSDHVLGQFLRDAAHADWFENTLFVITADHTSMSEKREYQSRNGIYSVPLIFYMPGKIPAVLSEEIAQHTDILGSVLGFLDYSQPYCSFGNDLFQPDGKRFSINYNDGTYQLIMDGWSLLNDGKHTLGLFELGVAEAPNQLDQNREVSGKMESLLKAIIQQYNYRLIHNQLTAEEHDE